MDTGFRLKNLPKTKESKQAFVGEAKNACLAHAVDFESRFDRTGGTRETKFDASRPVNALRTGETDFGTAGIHA